MRKAIPWIQGIALLVLLVDWLIIGLKIADNQYDFQFGAYLALFCLFVNLACALYRLFSFKCPNCGKLRWTKGKFCSYCGKQIDE